LKQTVALKYLHKFMKNTFFWSFTLEIDPVYVMHTDVEENK